MARLMTEIESMAEYAQNVWQDCEGVGSDIVSALEREKLITTETLEEYCDREFGKGEPEHEEFMESSDFESISSFTEKGVALLQSIRDGLKDGTLKRNPKYDGIFE